MTAVTTVAIAGGGVSALAAATALARRGIAVDVFETTPELRALGSGISLQQNALRVFREIGAWDDIRAAGFAFDGLALRAPGPDAPVIARFDEHAPDDLPSAMGIARPRLATILYEHAVAAGANVRFGATVTGAHESDASVHVELDGAPAGSYDLLIGADGLHSTVRSAIGIDTRPEPMGMGIWRAFVSRPAEVATTELYYGGPSYIAGYTPTGEDSMYAFLVGEAEQSFFDLPQAEARRTMHELSLAYGGLWEQVRSDLASGSAPVNYTWFTRHLVAAPWNRGRIVVIGDAAHSCPPTIAQGAAQALEDALVLAELLGDRDALDQDLWDAFHARRLPRAGAVVDGSVELALLQRDGEHERSAEVIGRVAASVAGTA